VSDIHHAVSVKVPGGAGVAETVKAALEDAYDQTEKYWKNTEFDILSSNLSVVPHGRSYYPSNFDVVVTVTSKKRAKVK
jgi:hypothetical protein